MHGHQPGHDGLTRRIGDGEEARLHRDDRVEQGDRVCSSEGLQDEGQRAGPQPHRRDERHLPAIEAVDQGTAVETEDDERHELEETGEADRPRGSGEVIDLEGDGHRGHLLTRRADAVTYPEPPEGRALAQRREVGEDASHRRSG